jgi:hypothetical protein
MNGRPIEELRDVTDRSLRTWASVPIDCNELPPGAAGFSLR